MTSNEMMLLGSISTLVLSVLGAWFAIAKFIAPFFKRIRKWTHTWEHFMEDWFGEEARPGVPGREGVMQRLATLDHELKPNGGGSIKDAVNRIETSVNKMDARLEEGDKEFNQIEKRLANLEKNL
jgi:hypothetical protein